MVRQGDDSEKCVVLLHGFGADMGDLFPLADILDPEGGWTFYCPQAPLEVPIGPMWTGRGWFPISLRELEAGVDFTKIRPPGLDSSRQLVSDLIFEINPKTLVLGGFSQGAMVATDLTMQQPDDVHGLIVYSGVLLDSENWQKKSLGLKGKPYLQSHGLNDSVLPYAAAKKLNEVLVKAGAKGSFISFPGAHEIPAQVVAKSVEFLRGL
jgi:phospholipase/carboxylesterase